MSTEPDWSMTRDDIIYRDAYREARDAAPFDLSFPAARGMPCKTREDEIREKAWDQGFADRAEYGPLEEDEEE